MAVRAIAPSTTCRQKRGLLYNRKILDGLEQTILRVCHERPLAVNVNLIVHSLKMPHAKIWIVDDTKAFDEAVPLGLSPRRWLERGGGRGCRAPLPTHLKIDLKGSFIDPETGSFWVDPCKEDRPTDLYLKGFT